LKYFNLRKLAYLYAVFLFIASTYVSNANAQDPLIAANKKLANLQQAQAIDERKRYMNLFCQNLALDGAKLGYKKKCAAYFDDSKVSALMGNALRIHKPIINTGIKIRVAMIGGIFSDCVRDKVNMYSNAKTYIKNSNIPSISNINFSDIRITGYSSSTINANLIANAIGRMNVAKDEHLIIVSYSKGTSDMIEALATYPNLATKIDAHLSIAGVVLGSPLANNKSIFEKIFKLLNMKCQGPDGKGLQSITTVHREHYLKQHTLPKNVSYYSLIGNASKTRTSIALRPLRTQLSLLGIKTSDAQVPTSNAVLPSSKVLGFMNADHWAIAMPFDISHPILSKTLVNKNTFPKEIMLSSALELIAQDLSR